MAINEDFYFAGDLSEAGEDRARLDHLERRLEVYLAKVRDEVDTAIGTLATIQAWGAYTISTQNINNASWTNIIWTGHAAGSDWRIGGSNHLIRPDVGAVYVAHLAVYWASGFTSSDLFGTRAFVNGSTNLGENRTSSVNAAPADTLATQQTTLNGSTDYVNFQVFQSTGATRTLSNARVVVFAIAAA